MAEFEKINSPLKKFVKGYEQNNPNILKDIITNLEEGNPFHYLFTGVVGCGKTYLTRMIMRATLVTPRSERWEMIKVIKFYKRYLSYITSEYSDKWSSVDSHNRTINTKLLAIDDLGDEKPSTSAAHDYFSGLIEMRYDYIYTHPESRTIISTNLNGNQIIKMYGSRAFDRLQEYFVICKFKPVSFREKRHRTLVA
jgi:DNA replication protein DnaC|tara:strand:+ start:8 stop:595 length:588 start_codon:yes stop_codon:yes gene_type:complete